MRRRRLLPTFILASSFVAPLLVSRAAHAQGWLADRRYTEGIGIKAGDFELHPGIGISAGVDSNWFNRTYNDGFVNSNPVAAGIFAVTPSFYMSTLQAQRKEGDVSAAPPTVDFRLASSLTYRAFVGDQEILNQNGLDGLSADFHAQVQVLPQRPFSFGAEAGYTRSLNPNTTGAPADNFNQNILNVGANFDMRPGGGTLDWKLGYTGNFDIFDASGGSNPAAPFNNFQNTIYTRGTWKFGPKTAVIYDGNFAFVNYQQQDVAFNGLQNSTPLRSRLGLNGLIGSRFGLTAFAGYGGSFVQTPAGWGAGVSPPQYDSVIGQLEAKFFLTANPAAEQNPENVSLSVSALAIGYNRDFAQSYLGSYYGSDRGYIKFSYFFGGKFLLSLEGGGGAREYPNIFDHTGAQIHGSFVDGAVDATLFAEYRFSNTLGLNLTGKYTEEISSQSIQADAAGDLYHMAFRRFEAYLGFRWFM